MMGMGDAMGVFVDGVSPTFDEDAACDACRELWLGMAERFKHYALNLEDMDASMNAAKLADRAYWFATGTVLPNDRLPILQRTPPQAA